MRRTDEQLRLAFVDPQHAQKISRHLANGGFRINGEKVADPAALVDVGGGEAELRSGKRRVRLVIEP